MGALNIIWGLVMLLSWSAETVDESLPVEDYAASEFLCPLDAGPDTAVCGFDHILMGSEQNGSWSVICSESRDDVFFENQFSDTTAIRVLRCGSYTFVYSVPTGPCAGTDTVVVTFLDPSELKVFQEVEIEVSWDVECHISPSEVICDNTVTITGNDPPELVWDICRFDSCFSRILDPVEGLLIDSCLVDSIGIDTSITTDAGDGCGAFSIDGAQDLIDAIGSLGTSLSCEIPPDSCHPCIDTIEVTDTLVVPVLMGGSWHYVDPTNGLLVPLMDSSFLQINGRDYLLIIDPGADYYGPGDIVITIWEIISGVITELTAPVSINLQWVPVIENDTIFDTRDEVVIDTACADSLKLPIPCGGISYFGITSFSGIPDFPCGPVSISFDVDDGNEFYFLQLNCQNPVELLEVCPDEFVDFDSPGQYEFLCLNGCPSTTIVEVVANFAQPIINGTGTNCASDQETYDVTFVVEGGTGPIEVLGAGTFNYGQTITITGIASCEDFVIGVVDPLSRCEAELVVVRCCCDIADTFIEAQICDGDTYAFNGSLLTEEGNYTETLIAQDGCDSIIHLELTVLPVGTDLRRDTICIGDSFDFYGQQLTQSGTYEANPTDANGCDSVVTLILEVDPLQSDQRFMTICEGETIDFYGDILSQAGSYEFIKSNAMGCDSVIALELSVATASDTLINAQICEGESYNFNGSLLFEGGMYVDTLVTADGCDSAITLELEVSAPGFSVVTSPSCAEEPSGTLRITEVTGGVGPFEYSVDGSTFHDRPDFDDLAPGDYDVFVVDAIGCSALQSVTVGQIPEIDADVADSYLVCGEDPVVIDVTQQTVAGDSVEYAWSTGSDSSTIAITTNGQYWVEIRNNCEIQRFEFAVTTEDESPASRIYVPNVFTPNDDGVNDHFKAFASVPVESFEMHIYDRWGEEVLIMRDIEEFWDGGFLGQNMQPGVYVWWLRANLENCAGDMREVMMRGDVTLIR